MKRTVTALIAGVLAAGAGANAAAADTPPAPAPSPQTVAQLAGNSQHANASATSTQIKPENTNVSVRVLSPGHNGSVSQSNSSTAAAIAANANQLAQSATQTAGGGNPGHGTPVQSAGQIAASHQTADATADSTQVKPKNTNVSVRVLSEGDDGDVTQENTSTALGAALNKNDTTQTASQAAGDGSPVQDAAQVAKSDQDAAASAESKQIEPENTNVSVRVLSDGHNGSVSQKNSSKAIGIGANLNRTEQTATQAGSGHGVPVQSSGQIAASKQTADATANSTQVKPKNTNVSVRVLSPGDDGEVSQENNSTALGLALNKNKTDQTVTQEQDGGYGDVAVQAAGQIAANHQDAWASAESKQIEPQNSNLSVPVLSDGDGGTVSQRNSSTALAASLNLNDLEQTAAQSQGGEMRSTPTTRYSPEASSEPEPLASALDAAAEPDKGESVSQENKSLAAAISANLNRTTQTATQSQAGEDRYGKDEYGKDGKDSDGVAVQAAGQVAANEQKADSNAESFQYGARNDNSRVSGPKLCRHDSSKPECKPKWWEHSKRCKPTHDSCRRETPYEMR
jgi:hypothetical protein